MDQARQRREPEPVGATPPRPAAELTAEDLVLVMEHQHLNIFGQI
ncbi:hypothetical protein AB0I81_08055 [Nonomuraea sp. NPDC050404]